MTRKHGSGRSARLVTVVTALWLATSITACGGDTAAQAEPRPLTNAEAAQLAGAPYANYQGSGAVFEANSAFLGGAQTQTVSLSGEIDWVNHVGYARVTANGPDTGLTEVYWDANGVYERRPGFDVAIAGRGGPTAAWIARPPDTTRQLDRLLAIIMGLATEQPDNALLVQQTEGSAFVRTDELRNTPVEVLRYGPRSMYWLETGTSELMRYDGDSPAGTAPTVIDLLEHRAVDVALPPVSQIVPIAAIQSLYSSVTGG